MSRIDRRIEVAELRIQRELDEIDRLRSIPEEPEITDQDGALVIWFQRRFQRGSQNYTYAAVKAGDGLWYTTGPSSPKGYTWESLMDWLTRNADKTGEVQVWIATEWSALS